MAYIVDTTNNKVYEVDKDEVQGFLKQYPNDREVTEEQAYLTLFVRISKIMEIKFSNYRNIDINQECYLALLKRYREQGVFAKDKPFKDNERIFYWFAKKMCFYFIREYKDIVSDIDVWTIEENETDSNQVVGIEDEHTCENDSMCSEIRKVLENLCISKDKADQQLGWYAKGKLNGLTDDQVGLLLDIGMPRIYELRRELRTYLRLRYQI